MPWTMPRSASGGTLGRTSVLALGLTGLVACAAPSRRPYHESEVEIHSTRLTLLAPRPRETTGIEIEFSVRAETLFYCPGARLGRKGHRIDLILMRVPVGGTPGALDALATPGDGGRLLLRVPLRIPEELPVEISLNGRRTLGEWEAPEPKTGSTTR